MRSTMVFSRGGDSITVNTPQLGYKTEIDLAIAIGERRSNGWRPVYDEGRAYDTRRFVGNIHYAPDQQQSIQRFVRDNRGKVCQLECGPGVYPFGPDCGSGRFQCRIVSWDFGPASESPLLWFKNSIVLAAITPETRLQAVPGHSVRGPLTIGTIDGLRFPPSFFSSTCGYGFAPIATRGGDGDAVDRGPGGDWWETDIDVSCDFWHAMRLCNYLVSDAARSVWSGRQIGAFRISCGSNSYMFGRDQCSSDGSGSYDVNFRENVIEVMHVSYDNYVVRLPLSCMRWIESGSLSLSSVSASVSGSKSSASVSSTSVSGSKSKSSTSVSSMTVSSSSHSSNSSPSSSSSSSLWAYF